VRKGERRGLEVRFGHELVTTFFDLYAESMRMHGSPTCGIEVFRDTLEALGDDAQVAIAYQDDEPAAGKLYVDGMGRRHFIWGCNRRRFQRVSAPNFLLMWRSLEDAMARGIPAADFGRSDVGSTHAGTKVEWGCAPEPLPYYNGLDDAPGSVKASDPRFAAAVRVWQRLPLGLTRWLGPPIARQIP